MQMLLKITNNLCLDKKMNAGAYVSAYEAHLNQ